MHPSQEQWTKKYKARQDKKGMKQVQVWVPESRVSELKKIASGWRSAMKQELN